MTRDPRLTLNARHQELLEWVQRDGFVTVDDLATHFDVTPQTIRRDVNWLAEMNLPRRYRGGASLPTSSENVSYTARQRMFHDEKRRIAARVATQIPDQASLFINLGTTTEEVARAQPASRPARDHQHPERRQHDERLSRLRGAGDERDRAALGQGDRSANSLSISSASSRWTSRSSARRASKPTARCAISTPMKCGWPRRSSKHARTVFLAADSSKFGRPALVRPSHLTQIDALFTDAAPPAAMIESLAAADCQVYVAQSPRLFPPCCTARETSSEIKVLAAASDRLAGCGLSKGLLTRAWLVFDPRLTTLQFPGVRSAFRVTSVRYPS